MAEPEMQLVNDANGIRGSGPLVSPGYLYPRRAEDGSSIECLLSSDGKLLLKGITPDKAIWYAQQLLNLALECKSLQKIAGDKAPPIDGEPMERIEVEVELSMRELEGIHGQGMRALDHLAGEKAGLSVPIIVSSVFDPSTGAGRFLVNGFRRKVADA